MYLELTWKLEENRRALIEISINITGKHIFCKASKANEPQNKHPDFNIGVIYTIILLF